MKCFIILQEWGDSLNLKLSMKKLKKFSLLTILIFINAIALAQLPDGVVATESFLDTIRSNYEEEKSFVFELYTDDPTVAIPLRVNIIRNVEGTAGVALVDIFTSVSIANGYFRNAGIKFFIDTVAYINDYNYSCITYNNLRKELLTMYSVSNVINLFLADTVKMGSDYSYGFTYFPDMPDSNFIYLDKEYARGNYLATLFGHYMGLLSTHETAGGKELVSGGNCSSAGDFICDTYADPGLLNQVADSCQYIGSARDEEGQYYIPTVTNIMSESPDECKCGFTSQQYRRIHYYFYRSRQYLLRN